MKSISWQAYEYPPNRRTADWYWTVGILTAALVVVSAILGNFLFGLVLAIGVFALTLFTLRRPRRITVEVTEKGIGVDKTLYPYTTLDGFGINEERPGDPRLVIRSKKLAVPLVAIPISYGNLDELREFVGHHLPEEEFNRGMLETILERIGF